MQLEIERFIEKNYEDLSWHELSNQVRNKYQLDVSDDVIRKLCARRGWGKSLSKPSSYTFEKSVVYGDLHTPFQDNRLLALFIDQFLPYFNPDNHFIDGDVNDWHGFSEFVKNPNRLSKFGTEIKITRKILGRIRVASPKSRIILIPGNHELRIEKYLWRRPEIASLGDEYINTSQLLKLDEHDIEYCSAGIDYHGIYIHHGDCLYQNSAASAGKSMDRNTCNLIRGHSHRGGTFYKTTWRNNKPRHYVGVESFCMCKLKAEYMKARPNWQQGWVCIYLDPKTKYFQIEPVCVVDYKFEFEGKMFKG